MGNKIHILWQDWKNVNIRNLLCPWTSPLPQLRILYLH